MLGLLFIRGRTVHRFVKAHEATLTVPLGDLAPSVYLAPGVTWEWQDWGTLDSALAIDVTSGVREQAKQRTRRGYIHDQVQGRPVAQTFNEARRFVISLM